MEYIEKRPDNGQDAITLKGEWSAATADEIEDAIEKALTGGNVETLDASGIEKLDTAGAWLMRKHFPEADISGLTEKQQALMDFTPQAGEAPKPGKKPSFSFVEAMIHVGEMSFYSMDFVYALFSFIGEMSIRLGKGFFTLLRDRFPSIIRHIHETGVQALPIIGLLAFGISMVISYQGAIQLRKFGAEIYTIDLTVISLLREMAVLTTSILVAGRSGSAFAAEIGVMKARREIDALRTMGLDPIETLVLPRLIALLITLPALCFLADIIGLVGGGVMATAQLNLSPEQYISRVQAIIKPNMFFVGMIKTPVFAFIITAVCSYQGMSGTGSAENVGKITTTAVVQSIFLIIMADAIFSVIFAKIGI